MATRKADVNRAKRPRFRREMIFSAAAELFRKQGYHGTRIEDIGAAVGMSGPAVYRHFPSKEALLTELLERFVERAQRDLEAALASRVTSPRETMERIVRSSVAHAVEESDLVVMAGREIGQLPPDAQRRLGRRQRRIVDTWVDVIRTLRPDLGAEDARVVAVGVAAMVAAATRVGRQTAVQPRIERITKMAMAALLAR
jgi:AcrR family transcriptional regulator